MKIIRGLKGWIEGYNEVKASTDELQLAFDFQKEGITTEEEAIAYLKDAIAHPNKFVAVDSETTCLYPRDGYVLGVSLCYKVDHGAYISADVITEELPAETAIEAPKENKVLSENKGVCDI